MIVSYHKIILHHMQILDFIDGSGADFPKCKNCSSGGGGDSSLANKTKSFYRKSLTVNTNFCENRSFPFFM